MTQIVIDETDVTFTLQLVEESPRQLSINVLDKRCGKHKYVGSVSSTEYEGMKVISSPEILLQMIQDGLAHKDEHITIKRGVYNDSFMIVVKYEVPPYLSEFFNILCSPQEKTQDEVIADVYRELNELTQKEKMHAILIEEQASKIEEQDSKIEEQEEKIQFLLRLTYVELNSALLREDYATVGELIEHHCPYNTETIILMLEHGTYQLYKRLNIPKVEMRIFKWQNIASVPRFSETANFLADPIWFKEIFPFDVRDNQLTETGTELSIEILFFDELVKGHHLEIMRAIHTNYDKYKFDYCTGHHRQYRCHDKDVLQLFRSIKYPHYAPYYIIKDLCQGLPTLEGGGGRILYEGGEFNNVCGGGWCHWGPI